MKVKSLIIIAAAVAAILASCAKSVTTSKNEAAKKVFESWLHINKYENAEKVYPGFYILSETKGSGAQVGEKKENFVNVLFTISKLDGTVQSTSDMDVAKRLGTYSETSYYGPYIWYRGGENIYEALDVMLGRMNVGGRAVIAIPRWLAVYKRYGSEDAYLRESNGSTDYIYDMKVTDVIEDVVAWEKDSVKTFLAKNYPGVKPDSLENGAYYVQFEPPKKPDLKYGDGDKIYLYYVGRLLNGKVFDTNIKDTAILHGLAVSNKGEALDVTWRENVADMKMGGEKNSMIPGFAHTAKHMKPGEKGRGIFVSAFGYSYNGTKNTIPPYSPLIFDMEITKSSAEK